MRRFFGGKQKTKKSCGKTAASASRGNMVFLHGVLYLEVIEGKNLPDVDTSWFRSSKDVTDPYITVDICRDGKKTARIAKTSIIYNSLNPHWGEKFRIELCHEAEMFLFAVKDMDFVSIESIGYVAIKAEDLATEEPVEGWYPVISKDGMPVGSLNVSLHFRSVSSIIRSAEIPDTVFQLHEGCRVVLYQDAHTPCVPPLSEVPGPNDEPYETHNLWIDIARHLEDAQKLIYIAGWSVKADIALERDHEKETLGEMLKRKATEGVRVLVMVWNEALSTDFYTPGLMGTHDEETRIYFEGSEVEVALVPRIKNKGKVLETNFVSTCYTHHQKCVILDTSIDAPENKRRLVAFIGGLDLTDGRWDTPEHPLFKSLLCEHVNDFYNGCCISSVTTGPRQPWHDIHARVEGRVVEDIIRNFTERWRRQTPDRENRLYMITEDEFSYDLESEDEDSWNVQFLRSINSDSALFDTDILDRLLSRKGRLYENSIQRAYIHQIRRLKHFLYVENQYFLGSSHSWLLQEAKCTHLIPVEIATKIQNAIISGEDFRAYIVIPLHPEGDPASAAVQEILYWQYRTMEMMYRKIAKVLQKINSSANPTDYLSFFCLGKKESPDEIPDGLDEPDSNSVAAKVREHLRFMIYVHSKMAVFDDEYIIVGSANINERSMSGNRDSEMAIGAFQPKYTKENGNVEGTVRSFRLSVWAEHCGAHMPEHLDPSSLECMTAMRELGMQNLEKFLVGSSDHNDSHLLLYPVVVSQDGHVSAMENCKEFPDTAAPVLGKNSMFLPNSLTT